MVVSMANGSYAKLEGLDQLFNDLEKMGKAGDRAQNKALKEGGKIFLNLAKSRVNRSNRKSSKHLIDAMQVSPVKKDDTGEKYVSVGTYLGKGNYRNDVYWGHIVEGGHFIKTKSGKTVGYVSAKPFMQPAYEQGQDAATEAIAKIIFKEMGLN